MIGSTKRAQLQLQLLSLVGSDLLIWALLWLEIMVLMLLMQL